MNIVDKDEPMTTKVTDTQLEALADDDVAGADQPPDDGNPYDLGWAGRRSDQSAESGLNTQTDAPVIDEDRQDLAAEADEENEPDSDSMPESAIDEEMVNLAERLGMPRRLAEEFESPADLRRAMMVLADRRYVADPQASSLKPLASSLGSQASSPQVPEKRSTRGFRYAIDLNGTDDIDDVLKKMGPLHEQWAAHTNGRFDENEAGLIDLAKRIGVLGKGLETLLQRQKSEDMDRFFAGLGEEYKELGTGPTTQLPKKSAERRLREQVIRTYEDWENLYRQRGRPASVSELAQRALLEVFHDKHSRAIRSAKTNARARRAVQTAHPPKTMPKGMTLTDLHEQFIREQS